MWIACLAAPVFFLVLLTAGNALERWVAGVTPPALPVPRGAPDDEAGAQASVNKAPAHT